MGMARKMRHKRPVFPFLYGDGPWLALLLKNALRLVTMDAARREIEGGWVLVRDRQVAAIGTATDPLPPADDVMDMTGHMVMPGMVNTHHHMYQTLTRVIPAAQDASLFGWLQALYPIWAGLTPEMIRVSACTAMTELLWSGCTTSSDHLYCSPTARGLMTKSRRHGRWACAFMPPVAR